MRQALITFAAAFLALTGALYAAADSRAMESYAGKTISAERTKSDVVGASISHPDTWSVERERQTYGDTYGFTLWKTGSVGEGGSPTIRVALAYGMEPGQIERTVRERLADYPDLPLVHQKVSVGDEGRKGVAVGPIPGSTPFMEVYVPVRNRVYKINVYSQKPGQEKLNDSDRKLLSSLRFYPPSKPVSSLDLPGANAHRALYRIDDQKLIKRERAMRDSGFSGTRTLSSTVPDYGEKRIAEGCWLAKSTFYFQTQHGSLANKRWGKSYEGWTKIGRPNFWNEYTHGSLDYGRCDEPYYTNDKFAIDYPLGKGDTVYSPFKSGTVTFAGRNQSHEDYGIFVSIRADNGKYVNLSGHLSSLVKGIKRGVKVTNDTVIGYAGATGGPNIPVGETHLHQAFYRYPSYNPDGSPYGGAGLQVLYFHYTGTAAGKGPGVYKFGWTHTSTQKSKGDWISN